MNEMYYHFKLAYPNEFMIFLRIHTKRQCKRKIDINLHWLINMRNPMVNDE